MIKPEQLIISGCRKGVRSAQQELYCHFKPVLLGICKRYVQDDQEAHDVLHDVFIKVFSKIKSFKGDGSFEGWLKRLTVNHCLNVLRKQKQLPLTSLPEEDVPEKEVEIDVKLSKEVLLNTLTEISIDYSIVFSMFVIDGYTHDEIALELGIKEQTSRTRLHKAKALLRQKLSNVIHEG